MRILQTGGTPTVGVKVAYESGSMASKDMSKSYSVTYGASHALHDLLDACRTQLPAEILEHYSRVVFSQGTGLATNTKDLPVLPCPMREQEAAAAIMALDGIVAVAIADLRFGKSPRMITVDLPRIALSLMSSYVTTLDGRDKGDPSVRDLLPDTDLNAAQSILYRRLSANLYATRTEGSYYHIHGSLDATKTLKMLGLEPFRPDLKTYKDCLTTIGHAVKQLTTSQLEVLNAGERQAGAPALTRAEFAETNHGQAMATQPPYTLHQLESSTPPIPFPSAPETWSGAEQGKGLHAAVQDGQILRGIRVIELCRVIAGPTIGRSLAAHGASVLKVTSPYLSDVPFFQVDVNHGKHTASLDLRNPKHRAVLDDLLSTADVVIDGYRPGALDRLGYGPERLTALAQDRGWGIVYVAEDCFGGVDLPPEAGAEWATRPGWQQIADCVTGVAWEQGRFMGLKEPVVPPFPMSDYGTGVLGCVAALTGLYLRATVGGSWLGRTSLCQYNLYLFSLGIYPEEVLEWLRRTHDASFFSLQHDDSVDVVGERALRSIKRLHPHLFRPEMMQQAWSQGFGATVAWPRESLSISGMHVGYLRTTRPNGVDELTWEGWEVDDEVLLG